MFTYLESHTVNELSEIMGDDLGMLFETFLHDSEAKIAQLVNASEADESDFYRRVAHSIKGSSRNVGANSLASACDLLEKAAKNAQRDQYPPLIASINETFLALKEEILRSHLIS